MKYVVLNLSVKKASMLQSLAVLTPAPVFAAIMAMHALDRKMGGALGIQGVGLVHHDVKPWIEHVENKGYLNSEIVQRRGAFLFDSYSNPSGNPMQPMALCDLEWSVLLACAHDPGDLRLVENTLLAMRLAGGAIHEATVRGFDLMDEALRSLPSGFWIADATDELAQAPNPVRELLEMTQRHPWVVPANLGYALLCNPGERSGSRDGSPHAFAEHMMGLLRYTSIYKIRADITYKHLWRYGWDSDQFLVTNRPNVQLSTSFSL